MNTLIKLNEQWGFKIDSHSNHMLYEYREIKNKKGGESVKGWAHTGTFHPNVKQMFSNALYPILRDREFEGDSQVDIKEFMQRLNSVLEDLSELYENYQEVLVNEL